MRNDKLTFKPSIKSVTFGIVGIIFFGAFTFIMLSNKWTVNEETNEIVGSIIMWIITLIFLFFTLSNLVWLLNTKIIKLNSRELQIIKPLIFLYKSIYIKDIKKVYQKKYKIKSSFKGQSLNVYDGLKTIVVLKNEKEIYINSFDTIDYNKFNRAIKQLISSKSNNEFEPEDISTLNKWNGVGWLVFAIFTALIIIWAFIIKPRT
ncbi:hypothetical protein H9W90_04535 [Polaribacter pectinis]|uniref:PH domain-containing protein n=1 Tax=Polaribacter pectinis TaxID=2738844 RepID=A0A7G9LCP8_9FLAO|nr:hypothetical protein [Polaribacter pectinis]QNM86397.1 hypothetical protein H9W90_04535 [Polaribacter pectinis]